MEASGKPKTYQVKEMEGEGKEHQGHQERRKKPPTLRDTA
jgi:hypothetical protein